MRILFTPQFLLMCLIGLFSTVSLSSPNSRCNAVCTITYNARISNNEGFYNVSIARVNREYDACMKNAIGQAEKDSCQRTKDENSNTAASTRQALNADASAELSGCIVGGHLLSARQLILKIVALAPIVAAILV